MRVRLSQPRLQAFLAQSPLSQNHWALKLGLSRGHWSEIVNGKHPYPSPKTRERMLEVLGLPFEELFEIETGTPSWADTDFRRAIADRYLIDTELGQGGMGAVYLARDARHGRVVAVKVISPEAVSGIGVTQFLREIATVAQLQHPHILPLHDSGEAAGRPLGPRATVPCTLPNPCRVLPVRCGVSEPVMMAPRDRLTLAQAEYRPPMSTRELNPS